MNRLANESSPYLRQHAHNPVDWYPWGEEAFAAARRANKPILLSVGYSACHWCHVMERESFEDAAIARLMNEHFVNIKVDREERPDVDHIYMNAVQLLTGRGGWPMTVFLTPEGRPFYGGTYFPPVDRHGMPGFPRLLELIARKYREAPGDIDTAVREIGERLHDAENVQGDGALPRPDLLVNAAAALARAYDERHGGIGQAPKFPNTAALDLFLRAGHLSGDARYTAMTLHTLREMARGGIYDQLGGGFHRYSVDARWLVPHFEKMLYDNAQLVPLYLAAFQISGDRFFANVAHDTLDYVAREMRDPEGGFYSTQDADSEGIEGKYFLWDRSEVEELLGAADAEVACRIWDVSDAGNFEGRNILHVTLDDQQAARLFERSADEIAAILARARQVLFTARAARVAPGRDEKMLTAWNALMISAYARAAEVLDDDRYAAIARAAVAFVDARLRNGDRLLATCKDGVSKLNAYLDDYAFYVAALLDLYEAVQESAYLQSARSLVDSLLEHFWDRDSAGFFFTSDDHEELIVRSKPSFDGSIPSGNAIATMCLLRLYHHSGETAYLERAEDVLRLYGRAAANQSFGMANFIAAADFHARGPREIAVVTADRGDPLLHRIRALYLPNRTLSVLDPQRLEAAPPLLRGKGQVDGRTTVYVCHRMTCSAPVTTWEELEPLLAG